MIDLNKSFNFELFLKILIDKYGQSPSSRTLTLQLAYPLFFFELQCSISLTLALYIERVVDRLPLMTYGLKLSLEA